MCPPSIVHIPSCTYIEIRKTEASVRENYTFLLIFIISVLLWLMTIAVGQSTSRCRYCMRSIFSPAVHSFLSFLFHFILPNCDNFVVDRLVNANLLSTYTLMSEQKWNKEYDDVPANYFCWQRWQWELRLHIIIIDINFSCNLNWIHPSRSIAAN